MWKYRANTGGHKEPKIAQY